MQFRWHTTFPPDVMSLIEAHRLGSLRKKHREGFIRWFQVVLGGVFLLIAFLSVISSMHDPPFGSPASLGHPPFVCTLGIILSLSIVFLVAARRSDYVAYECSNGFIILRERQWKVEFVLTWDRLVAVRKEERNRSSRYLISYRPTKHEIDQAVDEQMRQIDAAAADITELATMLEARTEPAENAAIQGELKELAQLKDEEQREKLRVKLAKQVIADDGTMDYQLFSVSLWQRCRLELRQRQKS